MALVARYGRRSKAAYWTGRLSYTHTSCIGSRCIDSGYRASLRKSGRPCRLLEQDGSASLKLPVLGTTSFNMVQQTKPATDTVFSVPLDALKHMPAIPLMRNVGAPWAFRECWGVIRSRNPQIRWTEQERVTLLPCRLVISGSHQVFSGYDMTAILPKKSGAWMSSVRPCLRCGSQPARGFSRTS